MLDSPGADEGGTERFGMTTEDLAGLDVLACSLETVDEPGTRYGIATARTSLGSHPSNDIVLDDPTVSRFHAEILATGDGARLVDVGSSNGTLVDGVRIRDVYLRDGARIELGRLRLVFRASGGRVALPVSDVARFGELVGRSAKMRGLFAMLARAAASDSTILLEGETGTGKEAIAEAIHRASPRASGPFVVVDASAIPHELAESELFGHEKGSFTGALGTRIGAFEEARGGTLFLDEIGELPIDLQPKLLRALEQRAIRRIGGRGRIDVELRVVAATNRQLAEEVNAGRFRADLFYRLAVVRVAVPPLRERLDDLPMLVDALLDRLRAPQADRARLTSRAYLARLAGSPWPGNVRELRNVLERALVLGESDDARGPEATPARGGTVDARLSYAEARDRALARFEHEYVAQLLALHQGNVSLAAREAGMTRAYLHRLIRRHDAK